MAGVFAAPPASPVSAPGAGIFASGAAASNKAPIAPAASSTPPEGYFYAKNPDGSTIGASSDSDPYSGRPYFAYRTPGATATTTDYTRTATQFDPEKPEVVPKGEVYNPRMPESASEAIRGKLGATGDEQLDHWMALALSGSNNEANLRLIPTSQNQASSQSEGDLEDAVAGGKESLFQAQATEAKDKGQKLPFTDGVGEAAHNANLLAYLKNALSMLPSELAGIKNPF